MPTLTGKITDLGITDLDARGVVEATVTSNAPGGAFIGADNALHLDATQATVTDGVLTIANLPDTSEIENLRLQLHLNYPAVSPGGVRSRKTMTSGWFEATADLTLADVVDTSVPNAPAISSVAGAVTEATTAAATATAASTDAAAAQAAAEAARDQAHDLSQIDTSDGVVHALVTTDGSATASALDARIAQGVEDSDVAAAATDAQTKATALTGLVLGGYAFNPAPTDVVLANLGVSGHGFGMGGSGYVAGSSSLNDTADYFIGAQAAKIVSDGTKGNSGYLNIDKSSVAYDFTARYVRLWLKVDDVTKWRNSTLYLGTDASNAYTCDVFFQPSGDENVDLIRSGEWVTLDVPWSSFSSVGTPPARNAITFVRLLSKDRASGALTVHWNGMAAVAEQSRFPNGVISLTFDDTYVGQYNIARPYMDLYGYAGTLYPITEAIGTSGCWTMAQGLAMQKAGWDYGVHATSGSQHSLGMNGIYTNGGEAALRTELETMRAFLRQNGLRGDSAAYPLNTFDLNVERVIGDYFRSCRAGGPQHMPETFPPRNPYRLRALNVNAGLTVNKTYVDKVKAGKAWGIFTLHDIVASGATGNNILASDFQALIDYIHAQGVAVLPVSKVMALAGAS